MVNATASSKIVDNHIGTKECSTKRGKKLIKSNKTKRVKKERAAMTYAELEREDMI